MTDVAQSKPDATTNHLSLQPSISESEETRERERDRAPEEGKWNNKKSDKNATHEGREKKESAVIRRNGWVSAVGMRLGQILNGF